MIAATSEVAQAALDYAHRGWPVFPCDPATKRPLLARNRDADGKPIPGTGGVSKASTDAAQVAAWWAKWPRAMIGLAVGRAGLLVVDFDPRREEATDPETGEVSVTEWTLEQLKADLEAQMGCALPASLAVRTPSGGVHVYLRMPEGEPIGNRGNLPRHVDVRGLGGYVIAPPSIADAGAYRWLRDDAGAPVAELPDALVTILRTPAAKPSPAGSGTCGSARSESRFEVDLDEAHRRYALRALDEELAELERTPIGGGQYGGRNAGIYHAALKLGGLVLAGALRESVVRAGLEAVVRAMPQNDDLAGALRAIDNGFENAQPRDLSGVALRARPGAGSKPPRAAGTAANDDADEPTSQPGSGGDKQGLNGDGADEIVRECAMLAQTDLGNLQRFLRRHGRDFLFVEQWGWLAWDGSRWNRDMAVSMLGRAVQDTMRAIQDEAALVRDSGLPADASPDFDAEQLRAHEAQQRGRLDRVVKVGRDGTVTLLSDTIARWGRTSEGAGHIGAIPKMAEARLAARPADFDADQLLVNMANGTLVFTRPDGGRPAGVRLVRARRADRITKIGTATYDPVAACPAYDAFLARVQPDEDMRGFLDVWAGYNMLGDASAQKMAIFHGEGANGKGVWINVKRAVLGDYAWAASIDTFTEADRKRKGSDATPDLAALAGRRMVYANEADEGSRFSDGLVKELTSDEPKGGVRELMRPPFELIVTFKNTIIANNRPRIGTDHGIRRRMQLVPWDVIVPHEEQDPRLKAKLIQESAGILNRMVAGALRYLTDGLPMPEAVRKATEQYLDENDLLGRFLALCVERVDGETMGSSALHELFAAWQTWAQLLPANGKPWSPKYLSGQMERKGFKKRKSSSMVWDGVWPLYQPTDFVRDGRPVETDLPAPCRRVATAAAPAPPPEPNYEEDMPL